jgi:hypothetical protein
MAEISSMTQTEAMDVEFTAPRLQLPDAASMAEAALAKALKFCAQKMGLDSHQAVVDRLRQGDSTACSYCHYSLAKQVAESLGTLDENVKAVYVCDYDATPEDLCFGEATQAPLVHLVVWARRKTGALNSLVAALDRASVQSYADLIGMRQLTHLLDVQVIDDADVENRVGYGAMLSSIHHRPIQVWER